MKQLQNILYKVHLKEVQGSTDKTVSGIAIDSRQVQNDYVFVALKGEKANGHNFIPKAIELGATVIVCEEMPNQIIDGITYLQVNNSHETVAIIAHQFYEEPSTKIKLVGVTGTNGKTTIATVLFKLFTQLGYKCGLISTVQNQIGNDIIPSTHTTPDAVSLNQLLIKMIDANNCVIKKILTCDLTCSFQVIINTAECTFCVVVEPDLTCGFAPYIEAT